MTREDAEQVLTEAGTAEDDAFPLLEAAIACAIHDYPFRETGPVRTLAANVAVEMPESEVGGSHYRVLFLAALVLLMFTCIRERFIAKRVPRAFRGTPLAMLTAGLMSLAFMGFVGL